MNKKVILLIEDDAVLGEIMKKRIEEDGYRCFWEHDGKDGIAKLLETRPDLILLDIVMPNMNGYEVLERINADKTLFAIPVVVISNSGQPVEIEKILKLGVKDYIVKAHFSPEEVLEKVKNLIGGGGERVISDPLRFAKALAETKILIIEDEQMLSDIVSKRFREDKFQVFIANNGEVGLDMAEDVRPDLILLDLIMPGMGGFDVLKKLKESNDLRVIPVVILSNLAQEGEIARARRLGVADFLVKADFTPTQIVERTKSILAKVS